MVDGATPPPPKGGPRALGKYSILRELGRGGMGIVYEAVDTQINRKVALKLLLARPMLDPERAEQDRQRFAREAQMAAKLKHPGVVTLYEAGEIQGKRYLALELIDGKPLQLWLRKKPLREQVAALRDVALAVHHAHEQGVLHRDLKPANVLVRADGAPCVMDFGLAKVMGTDTGLSVTSDGMCVGTPAYMSPEQARGAKTVDGRTDVYSMGVILYEMLSGRHPFEGETAIEILMKASKERAPKPSTVSQVAVDPAFDGVIESISLKALEKEPGHRYASAKAFADDLTRWLNGESVHVTTVHRTRRRLSEAKRAPAWLWPAVGAAALVLALGAWMLLKGPSAPPPVDVELARARQLMKDGKPAEARIEYARALAKAPENAEAKAGDAAADVALKRAEAERQRMHREELAAARQTKDLAAADAERAKLEAEQKLKSAASDAEQKRLQTELEAIRAQAKKAEEDARLAREELQKAEAKRDVAAPPAPAPAAAVAPTPAPAPAPKPLPKPLPPAVNVEARLAALAATRDAAAAKLDYAAAFAAVDAREALSEEIDGVAEKNDILKAGKKGVKSREDAVALGAATLRLAEDALEADDYKTAPIAARDAGSVAKQAGDAPTAERAAALAKEITALKPLYDRYVKSAKLIETKPEDGAAQADVGRWLCLVKGRWPEGLPHLEKSSDLALRKLAEEEKSAPGSLALADDWYAAAQKERNDTMKSRLYGRALACYEAAVPLLSGPDRARSEKRVDECIRLSKSETRITFLAADSMKLFPVGHRQGMFPEQKTDDAVGPFRGEAVYFMQMTGTDAVYSVRAGRPMSRLYWKGAAMQQMQIEIVDPTGAVIAKSGPHGGGNTWAEHTLDFPPTMRFTIRLRNFISTWYLVDTLTLQ